MAEEIVTIDTIIDYLKQCVEHKVPVDAHTWTDAAQKMLVLLGDEHDKLFEAESIVARQKLIHIEAGESVAKANARIQAEVPYKLARMLKARIGRVEEMIRIAKIQAKLKDTEMRGYT